MSNLKIKKGHLPDVVNVPASKSYANRALILASLKTNPVQINNMPHATDVTHLVTALSEAGLICETHHDSITVKNSFPQCEVADKEIFVGEGGTTARFLAALLLLGKKRYTLKLGKRLKERPWQEYLETVKSLGAYAELRDDLLILQGPITIPKSLSIDCSRTTQFATAFDLILDQYQTKISPRNLKSSESYLKMNGPLKEHFKRNDSYSVPLDWSSAAFPMVFAALSQEISFPGLREDSLQADSKIMKVLKQLGSVSETTDGLIVNPISQSSSVKINMSDCLDLFPAMAFLVSHIHGTHELSGLDNLAHKESDRLNEVCALLTHFERSYEVKGDSLVIEGSQKICGEKSLSLPDDHRIVMIAALFLCHHSGGTLNSTESVNKSYPGFFDLMRSQ
ncbi:MAG: hypothetical protein V4598_13685 [Bdellovibrionota bacterium]